MSDQLVNIYNKKFATVLEMILQERGPKLLPAVMASYDGQGENVQVVDRIGTVAAQQITDRNVDITPANPTTSSRWVSPTHYDAAVWVNSEDKMKIMVDPTSEFVQSCGEGMNRAMNQAILDAAYGTALTGKAGTGTQAFSGSNARQIAVNYGGGGNTGLTIAKLLRAKKLLLEKHVDLETDSLWCIVTSSQWHDLMKEPQYINRDYNAAGPLPAGTITPYMGINFIHCELVGTDSSSYRRVPLWARSGMHIKFWEALYTSIDKLVTKRGHPIQIYMKHTFGSVRLYEEKIIEILCAE